MIGTKFHENRSTIDREINEKHGILADTFNSIQTEPEISRASYFDATGRSPR